MTGKDKNVTKTKIGKTTYVVNSIFDQNAEEDLINKLYNKFKQDDNEFRLCLINLPPKNDETHD